MRRKSGVAMGVVVTCMAAIIIFGRVILEPPVNNAAVSEVQEQDQKEAKDEEAEPKQQVEVIAQDIYVGAMEKENTIKDKQPEPATTPEVDQEKLKEEQEKKRKENLKKERKKQAEKAVDIKNPEIEVSAKAAVLYNAGEGKVLYSKNALTEIQPASTAKLLTAITAVELSGENEEFTVGSEIDLIASDSSRAYLVKGQILSLDQILDALLLPSGNDAAYVIAANLGRKIAGDSNMKPKKAVKTFVKAMNEKADEIGVVHSNFCTPDGYDAKDQYTTAYDMAIIGTKALEYDIILETVKKPRARDILISGEDVSWTNSNRLIKKGSGYYYSYAIGLKTGTSGEAGRCLVSAAKKESHTYVSVVMNASYDGRWQDSVDLLRYAIGLK